FHGALEAASRGEMLASSDGKSGAGGYVALELVRGTLDGREGSFVLQHSSTMAHGAAEQSIVVVPESGTGAPAGLRGRMVMDIAPGGAHAYRFDYELPDARGSACRPETSDGRWRARPTPLAGPAREHGSGPRRRSAMSRPHHRSAAALVAIASSLVACAA